MLTSDLLVTRAYKGSIEPVYAPLNEENTEIASSVIGIFQRHVGKTHGELIEELEGFENINYRFIRGLAQILERRCVIDIDSVIDPMDARRVVFEESRGLVTSHDERKEVLDRAAERLSKSTPKSTPKSTSKSGSRLAQRSASKTASKTTIKSLSKTTSTSEPTPIKPDDLEKALWADQGENLLVKEFQIITPEDLLRQYNLSVAQTLLFKATGMEIQVEGNYQRVFRKIKQLGLMYSILDGKIYLDGPISLFKLTEKYGTAFAKLLPIIMESTRWCLKASILKKTPQGKRVYAFNLDYTSREIFGIASEELGFMETPRPSFDSAIEKEFYQLSFHGWTVRREPAVLKAGQYAFIPDFSLERNGTRIYVEIVGFWTPEYLQNKILKINRLDEEEKESILLLVNRNLGCSGSEFNTDKIIFYDRKIPHLEIIKVLRRYEEKQLTEEITKLRNIEISLDSGTSVIGLDEIAGRYGVSLDAAKEVVKGLKGTDYQLLGDQLVSSRTLKSIQDELAGIKKHDDALRIFERYGVKAHSQALESLGYKVKWIGLDPENAEIIKARV